MALNGTWGAAQQIVGHKAEVATRPELGMSPFNIPEGFFVYARGKQIGGVTSAEEVEYACDLHLQKIEKDGIIVDAVCLGVQFMCPRCSMGLFIPATIPQAQRQNMAAASSKAAPQISDNARPVYVHWDRMTQSQKDRKFRPLVTIEGAIACDYSMHEINGVAQPIGNIQNRCGWVGILEEGRLYDHEKRSGLILPSG